MHTDVWGLAHVSSLGVFNHFVTFIDDATRKTWVYCIQKSIMFLILLRNGKLWLRMRQERN